ncbi:helix-turn-helix transcriptional regulator [Streptomyces sp. VRA16 Mangrove soil]|uniref:helix-turn-helix domain-containing protein n=1 Tax=Streptomyces sp. VRA16 Mangrove soil TaxID=2817434 RepID=UPI001A9F06AA|nr:helix-turn-helix transcriptional regulator [Streptomyces sp. VRA16 Mangrove soil]MBO1336275.1 helix-turn-helix transcriptional regulator [Streptomyces sp. VRA16 Mangrove soil]
MQHKAAADQQPTPPFNAPAARRLREALGMAPGHVAYGMRASYGLAYVTPDVILAWERGDAAPTAGELTALAGALWCSPAELIGAPRTLREHRLTLGVAPEDVARFVGLEIHSYLRMEETGEWRGSERQSSALAEVLRLSPRSFATVTGRDAQLAELLRAAAKTRWQGQVKPLSRLIPVQRRELEDVLHEMHLEYQALMAATLSWGGGASSGSGNAGHEFLDRILEEFWSRIRNP